MNKIEFKGQELLLQIDSIFSLHMHFYSRWIQLILTYLLSSPPLHTWTPVAAKPHMQRFVRLPLIAPSTVALRPPRRCDSRTTRITCLSFISRVKPTPESQPLECNDGTDVSKLFRFLSKMCGANYKLFFRLNTISIQVHTYWFWCWRGLYRTHRFSCSIKLKLEFSTDCGSGTSMYSRRRPLFRSLTIDEWWGWGHGPKEMRKRHKTNWLVKKRSKRTSAMVCSLQIDNNRWWYNLSFKFLLRVYILDLDVIIGNSVRVYVCVQFCRVNCARAK